MPIEDRLGLKINCTANSDKPYLALVPRALPPADLDFEGLQPILEKANQALGRLDGIAGMLPSTKLFIYMYVRKEAVLSSQIEGTQSSLSDLLLHESSEIPGVPIDDVIEVSNYIAALEHGRQRIADGLPISNRLIKEMHNVLMEGARGGGKDPGEFRRSQNWLGGSNPATANYVPPPPDRVSECMNDLEKYIHHSGDNIPLLIRIGLIHHQFETIHPFLDGNGRLGRLLITLLLCTENVLSEPILYLSLYFKIHRQEYYRHLQSVRESGDWEAWLHFFLEGVREIAAQAATAAKEIHEIIQTDRAKVATLGRGAGSASQVMLYLERKPLALIPELVSSLGISTPAVTAALKNLQSLGIVKETTGRQRGRIYTYHSYLTVLARGTEPL